MNFNRFSKSSPVLFWILLPVIFFGLIFVRVLLPDWIWLQILLGVLLLANLGFLAVRYRASFKTRTAAYGLQSAIMALLVLGIVGVLNFLASRYPLKADLTRNQVHTLSDQTRKVVKNLRGPVRAVFFGNPQKREEFKSLLENYGSLNTKFEVEYVNPDLDPTRTKQAGIKKHGTLQLLFNSKTGQRDAKVEDPTEEKLTNALIKLLKEKPVTVCSLTGHGEPASEMASEEGLSRLKSELQGQSYDFKEITLAQEGKIPEVCDGVLLIGPNKAFFPQEIELVKKYLASGGRMLIALNASLNGKETAPEIVGLLKDWGLTVQNWLVIDPASKLFGVDAATTVIQTYDRNHPITRDFQPTNKSVLPLARPVEMNPVPIPTLKVSPLTQSLPVAWAETNFTELAKGQVKFDAGVDKQGPITVGAAVEGKLKDSTAPRPTRLVVFGTALHINNNGLRFGSNLDLVMNSISWILEDESMISIRTKEEDNGKITLTQSQGTVIFLITVIMVPLFTAGLGIFIWWRRRQL